MVRRGITLVEVIVAMMIVALLFALIAPSLITSKEAGKRTSCTEQLRQIGLATQMYLETEGGMPRGFGAEYLVKGGYLTDKRLLKCPSDTLGGMGSAELACHHRNVSPGVSYYTPFDPKGIYWDLLKRADDNPGIFACRLHGSRRQLSNAFHDPCEQLPFLFEGTVVRLRLDTSVTTFQISLAPTNSQETSHISYWKLFTDKPKPEER